MEYPAVFFCEDLILRRYIIISIKEYYVKGKPHLGWETEHTSYTSGEDTDIITSYSRLYLKDLCPGSA